MIATNAFKQGIVGTYSSSDTVIELDSISSTITNADYLPDPASGEYNLVIYDGLFGNPADARNAGSYEIVRVTGIDYSENEITVTRGQENTSAVTIGAGGWQAIFSATVKTFEDIQSDIDDRVEISHIIDNLTSTDTDKPLSANQGKVLQDTKIGKAEFDNATSETTFADTDSFLKSVSGSLRRFTWANLKQAILDFIPIELGTWAPVDVGGGDLILSFSSGNCRYIRIHKLCLIYFFFTYPSTSDTNLARVGGLPFTVFSSPDSVQGGTFLQSGNTNNLRGRFVSNTSRFHILDNEGNSVSNDFVSGFTFRGTLIYQIQ